MSNSPRILLYAHNTRGLGHASRLVGLAWGIYQQMPAASVLCCTGAMHDLAAILPPNTDYIKMPSFDAVEKNGKLVLFPARLNLERRELIAVRRSLLSAAASTFRPDILLADYTPLGKDEELEEAVTILRGGENRLILLGLRDILNDAERANHYLRHDVYPALRRYFDGAFVYSDPGWVDFQQLYEVPPDLVHKFVHVGFVVNDRELSRTKEEVRQELLGESGTGPLVILGSGGGKDATDVLSVAVGAWRRLQPALPHAVRLVIIPGPYIRPAQWQWLLDTTRDLPTVKVLHHVPYLLEVIRAADLYIGACGYNAFVEAMTANTPTIFIPHAQVDSDEQRIRAHMLQPLGGWQVVQPEPQGEVELAEAIITTLSLPPLHYQRRRAIRLDGAWQVARRLQRWYEGDALWKITEPCAAA